MKTILTIIIFLASIFSLVGQQNYTFVTNEGTSDYVYVEPNAITILDETVKSKDVLSEWQTIPFNWNFYGEPVSGYYASDNGYITFLQSETISVPNNTGIPNDSSPNKAIYAVWDDWNLEHLRWVGDKVKTVTLGNAPNRIHIIQWVGVTHAEKNDPNGWGFFAVRLYEGGDFDIVHEGFNGVAALNSSVTVGVENYNGSIATKVMGPEDEVAFGSTSKNTDGNTFTFTWELQPSADISFDRVIIPSEVSLGKYQFEGEITNLGFDIVNSFDVVFVVDGTTINTNVTGVSISSNATYKFTTNDSYSLTVPGKYYEVEGWTTNVNGVPDEDPSNNAKLSGNFFAINGTSAPQKKVLLEETTGTWCSPCIGGIMELDTIQARFGDDVNIVAFHGGADPMRNIQSQAFANAFGANYPNGFIDRTIFEGEEKVNVTNSFVFHTWYNYVEEQLSQWTPMSISYGSNTSYNKDTREVEAEINVDFTDYTRPGDLRIVLYVVEDSVTHPGDQDYYQSNAVSGSSYYSWHPFSKLANPIPDFIHKHVFRSSPNLPGNKGIINKTPLPGDSYSETITITLDESWNADHISLVALVHYFDNNAQKRYVLNSESMHLSELVINSTEHITPVNNRIVVYPNPTSNDKITVSLNLEYSDNITIDFFDLLGRKVLSYDEQLNSVGLSSIILPINKLNNGMYTISVSGSKTKTMITQLIVIE